MSNLQITDDDCGRSDLAEIQLQVPRLPPRLASLWATVAPPLWEPRNGTALTGLRLTDLVAAAVQPALAALQHLPSLHSFVLTSTPDVGGHLGAMAPTSCLRSLTIAGCGLHELPELQGAWATGLTYLDLSDNNLAYFPPSVRSMLQLQVLDLSYNAPLHLMLPGPTRNPHEPHRCVLCVNM